jgi:(2Fe-2S) ferredoxin
MPRPKKHVFLCVQTRPEGHEKGSCTERNCRPMVEEFVQQLIARNLQDTIAITTTSCLGPCRYGPNVLVYPDGVMYGKVTKEDVTTIFEEHLIGDKPVERLKVPEAIW